MKKAFLSFALALAVMLSWSAISSADNNVRNLIFDVENGGVTISGISETANRVYYGFDGMRPTSIDVPKDKVITVIGSTNSGGTLFRSLKITSGTDVTVKLSNVKLNMSMNYMYGVIDIDENCNVKLILEDGSMNRLTGGYKYSTLRLDKTSSLEISGNGALYISCWGPASCIGGYSRRWYETGDITINGGTIIAYNDGDGLAIGSNNSGSVVINGGNVTATAKNALYDIAGKSVTINGGTIYAGNIKGADGSITVNGGSINLVSNGSGRILKSPKNSKGQPLYITSMTTKNANDTIEGMSNQYGLKDVVSNDAKKMYFYLPANAESEYTSLTYDGNTYYARVNTNGTAFFSRNQQIVIDTQRQQVKYYEGPTFEVKPNYADIGGFNVQYRKHGADGAVYEGSKIYDPGLYDVRVTRPQDDDYAAFEQEIEAGLELVDSFTYTVRYNGGGAIEGETPDSIHTYGAEQALNANGFRRIGFAFKGWGKYARKPRADYDDKQLVMNLTTTDGDVVNLYALWERWQYEVTYTSGQYGKGYGRIDFKNGGYDMSLKGALFTREGHAQTGWSTSDGGPKEYDLCGIYSTDAPITLYPAWEKTPVLILDADAMTTPCENLAQALAKVADGDTIMLTEDCDFGAELTVPENTTLDLGGFGLKCGKLTVSRGANLIIGAGQRVDISPNGESDAASCFTGLRVYGNVINRGYVTLNGTVVSGSGTVDMTAGSITLKGASSLYKIRLAKGVTIELDGSFMAGGVSGVIYLPAECYADGYEVLSGNVELESFFSLGNAPNGGWAIGGDGRLISGASGVSPAKPIVIPEHLVIGVGATVNVKNFFPDGFKGETFWYVDDEDVLRVVEKKGKRLIAGEGVGETTLKLISGEIVYKSIPVEVVAKERSANKLEGAGSMTLHLGERKPVGIAVKPDTAIDKTLFYHVDKPNVAIVENDEIVGIGKGNCRVTVVSTSGTRKVIKITVKKSAKIESAALSAIEIKLKTGEKATLEAIITPADADQSVKWSSKDPNIAKVKKGVITAKKPGTTAIMCKLSNGEKIGCLVTVTE